MSDLHHQRTVGRLFAHPVQHNLEWKELLAALPSVGELEEAPNGKYHLVREGRTLTFEAPTAKEVGEEEIVRLR